jgi:hypothetical protein
MAGTKKNHAEHRRIMKVVWIAYKASKVYEIPSPALLKEGA